MPAQWPHITPDRWTQEGTHHSEFFSALSCCRGFRPGVPWGLKAREGGWLACDHKVSGQCLVLLGSGWQDPRAIPHGPRWWTERPKSTRKDFWTCLVMVTPKLLTMLVPLQVLRHNSNPRKPPCWASCSPRAGGESQAFQDSTVDATLAAVSGCSPGVWVDVCAAIERMVYRRTSSHYICITYKHHLPENHDYILPPCFPGIQIHLAVYTQTLTCTQYTQTLTHLHPHINNMCLCAYIYICLYMLMYY